MVPNYLHAHGSVNVNDDAPVLHYWDGTPPAPRESLWCIFGNLAFAPQIYSFTAGQAMRRTWYNVGDDIAWAVLQIGPRPQREHSREAD